MRKLQKINLYCILARKNKTNTSKTVCISRKKHKKTIFKNCPHFILKKAQKIYLTCIVFYLEKIKQTRPKTVHMGRNRDKKYQIENCPPHFIKKKCTKNIQKNIVCGQQQNKNQKEDFDS